MTALTEAPAPVSPARPGRSGTAWRRALAAGTVLLACYVVLGSLVDPGGFLSTDTGGKVATLRVMEGADPDVGYWAERWDPDGSLHPLWYTSHVGDRWVNATTLPMLLLGRPLYAVGSYRLAVLLPMIGAVACAFAARALADRLAPGRGWAAFWLVGLASPVTVYALDFWEHAPGLAFLAWGTVGVFDALERRAGWRIALAAGLAIGAAGTMRTEALAYAAAWVAVLTALTWWRRRSLPEAVGLGAAISLGVAIPLAANQVLEQAVLDSGLRSGRATQTVVGSAAAEGSRVVEALVTFLSPVPVLESWGWALGIALLGLLTFVAVRGGRSGAARVAGVGVLAVVAVVAADGLGFVPGLVPATPLAAVALGLGWRNPRTRPVLALALLPLPLVWAFQYTGGAGPQWAGRYILASGLLLLVVGVCHLPQLVPWARVGGIALAVTVTMSGVGWLVVRSDGIADALAEIERRPEDVLVSRIHHLPREGGATYGDRRWLTAPTDEDVAEAATVVDAVGGDSFVLIGWPDDEPVDVPGFQRGAPSLAANLLGLRLVAVPYERNSAQSPSERTGS